MADPGSLRTVARIGRLAADAGQRDTRLAAALEAIAELTRCDGVSLASWDPLEARHRVVAVAGAQPPGPRLAEDPAFLRDGGYRFARRTRWPLRRSEVVRRTPPLRNLMALLPGIGEGLTACLFTPRLRYTGMLNLIRFDDEPIPDGIVQTLALAVPSLAHLTDMAATVQAAASLLPPDMAAVVLAADGRTAPLAGRASCSLLAPDGAALSHARARAPSAPGTAAFLTYDPDGRLWRVVVVRPGASDHDTLDDVIVVGAERAAAALSRRELEILALLAQGATNPAIADRLVLSRHTVATHVEHVLEKLGAPTRGAAAALAVREGLVLVT